ncbi:MAG: acyl-CoA dehydrogenase family protein [Acidimicrobiia bacterium]
MAWDFSTEPEFQKKLDWADDFVRRNVEPLDLLYPKMAFTPLESPLRDLVNQLKDEVRAQDLWAAHLEPELGGKGYGQLKLALLNEILSRSMWAPIVFGCAAPDTGNAEIIAAYGTPEQKAKYLTPLLEGEAFSCYSMTEPQGGADPTQFRCRAVRDGDEWVINGDKFFSSNLRTASFLIVMAVTNPDVSPYKGMSMFLVPADTPGIHVLHHLGLGNEGWHEGTHAHVRYENVRVPDANLLGGEGKAFEVAQRRLGGGRIHHAMRSVARAKHLFDMMCERALSRRTQGSLLADKQMVQDQIADSWIQIQQFRLLVMYTAWLIDQSSTAAVRQYVGACKVLAAQVLTDLHQRSSHIHGALGMSNAMGFGGGGGSMGVVDGPTEVHKIGIARQVLKDYRPHPDGWPSEFRPRKLVNARHRFEDMVGERFDDPETRHAFHGVLQTSEAPDDIMREMEQYLDLVLGNL